MKICIKCNRELIDSDFYKNTLQCKECKRKYNNEKVREYRYKNRDKCLITRRNYYATKHKYLKGITDPNSFQGISIITEHVVYMVLNDCEKCNTRHNFHAPYDLISKKYGTINVKSAILHQSNKVSPSMSWKFIVKNNLMKPDYYICIGFNEDRSEILKIWIIPSNAKIVKNTAISITNSSKSLIKAIQYEVNSAKYNKIYKNLDIYLLPEFCNLNDNGDDSCAIA